MNWHDQRLLETAMLKLQMSAGASITADEAEVLQLYGSDRDQALLQKQIDPQSGAPEPVSTVSDPAASPVPARAPATPAVTRKQFDALTDALKNVVRQTAVELRKRDERMASMAATLTELTTKMQAMESRLLDVEASQAAQVMRD